MKALLRRSVVLAFTATTFLAAAGLSAQRTAPGSRKNSAAQSDLYIYTYAGNGDEGYSGDGAPAIDAKLNGPWGVVVDEAGNLFLSDFRENRIRKIDAASGTISTIAGNGSGGYAGDGGLAVNAALYAPEGMIFDIAGDLIFADAANNRIRRIDAKTGVISTIAGNGTQGSSGDGDLAIHAELNLPAAVALDSVGNFYIADYGNQLVRKVDASTGKISTVAGSGEAGYSGDGGLAVNAQLWFPDGVAIDADNNLYIADSENNRIRKVDTATGLISTIAGNGNKGSSGAGGPAAEAELSHPGLLSFDAAGNLYLADIGSCLIREVEKSSGNILTLAGNGLIGYQGDGVSATTTALYFPTSVAFDSANRLYIADTNNARIRILQPQSTIATTTILDANPTVLFTGQTLSLTAFTTAEDGSIPTGPVIFLNGTAALGQASLDGAGHAQLQLQPAAGSYSITARYGGSSLDAASASSPPILVTVSAPAQTTTALTASSLALTVGQQLTLTATVHSAGSPVPTGTVSFNSGNTVLGTAILNASGVAALTLTPAEGAYTVVADFAGDAAHLGSNSAPLHVAVGSPPPSRDIYTFAGNGTYGNTGNGGPALDAQFTNVQGITSDPSGNIYIADPQSNVVRKVDHATGIITVFAGNGAKGESGDGGPALEAELDQMQSLASDQEGNIYICDLYRVRMVNAKTGIITTVAGTGVGGYTTTPGSATSVELAFPFGVATDLAGDLFISDGANCVIWQVDAGTAYMHVIAGTGYGGSSGDGGPATAATIYEPYSIAVDRAGNIYIAENLGNRIRKVDATSGIISTIAGTGTSGYSGDGGLAINAQIWDPTGLVADPDGNVYFSDSNYRVRRVDAVTGFIYTVAGNGVYAYGGDGGPATSAKIGDDDFLALDPAGNLYLADAPPNSIRVRVVGAKPGSASLATTTSLTASASTLNVGQPLTLTATVTAASGGSPTGTVTFTSGSSTLGSATLDSNGSAQLTLTLQAGAYLIQASYAGSALDSPSTSSIVPVTVQIDATTTSLSSSSTALTVGQTLTLTATVTASAGTTPQGAVTFLNGNSRVGTAQLSSNRMATLTWTPVVGTYSLTASYGGSAGDGASSSAPPLTVKVVAISSKTVLSASPNPAPSGTGVTFTAKVSGAQTQATGTVTFYDGATAIGTSSLASGAATLTTSSLAVGEHRVTATYSGSAEDLSSTSAPVTETITSVDFSLAASPASRTLYTGEAASFTVSVNPQSGFALDVSLACAGLPANTTCSFSPSTIAGGSGNTTLVIQTTAPAAASAKSMSIGKSHARGNSLTGAVGLAILVMPFGWRLSRRKQLRKIMLPLLLFTSLLASTLFTACAGSSTLYGGTPPGLTSIQVTGNASNGAQNFTHSVRVQLNVKSLF